MLSVACRAIWVVASGGTFQPGAVSLLARPVSRHRRAAAIRCRRDCRRPLPVTVDPPAYRRPTRPTDGSHPDRRPNEKTRPPAQRPTILIFRSSATNGRRTRRLPGHSIPIPVVIRAQNATDHWGVTSLDFPGQLQKRGVTDLGTRGTASGETVDGNSFSGMRRRNVSDFPGNGLCELHMM